MATMGAFENTVATQDELRELYAQPLQRTIDKEIDHIDRNCRAFIAHAPFVSIATASAGGLCEVSPRGGAPGWVAVLDEHRLLLPDDRGNNRLDSLTNIVETEQVGLLFLVPGRRETLRVNGRAWITTDADVLAHAPLNGKIPPAGIGVEVRTAFLQCGKALIRSGLWQPENWPDIDGLAPSAEMYKDHIAGGMTTEQMDEALRESYTQRLTW
jgi:PPOX class probable FMN-dependent enzyme